ncbi:MAG: hypothetical protein ACI4UK_06810 [Floccifex sp.]
MIKQFDSVKFDTEKKTMEILNGTAGIYPYTEILECKKLNELAKYKGKEEPFTHIYYGGRVQGHCFGEKGFYVGLKITLKNGQILAIYISKEKVYAGNDFQKRDYKGAQEIKAFIDKIIEKYRES